MIVRISIIVMLLGAMYSLDAQDNTPKYSNEFLSLGVGARAFAMGGTQAAVASDVTAGYWNPAGLMSIESDQQLILMHAVYFSGIANYDYGAFSLSLPDSSRLAISLIRFSVDDIPDTRFLFDANGTINYDNISFFSASDYAGWVSYAKRLNKLGGLDFGANLKVIHRLVGDFSKAWGFGLDIGLRKQINQWSLGLSGRDVFGTFNAWSHNPDEFRNVFLQTGNEVPVSTVEVTLPIWVLGVARNFDISSDINLLASADLRATFDGKRNTVLRTEVLSVDPTAGWEIGYREMLYLRFGIGRFQQVETLTANLDWSAQMSGGIGVILKDFAIDYALTDFGSNAVGLYSHVFSVKISFHEKTD